ncbi:MAG: alanine racemase [Pyrinomonadaceae bacterium]
MEQHGHNILSRPTWAEINLDNLASNFHSIKKRVGAAPKIMAMVKANAYGHGARQCAKRLAAEGADWFGVATPEEGIELRETGITQPILCAAGFWSTQAQLCIQHKLTPVIYRLDMAELLDRAARDAGVVADVHVKIDTGMGRLGVRFDALDEFAARFAQFRSLRVDGLLTHFAAADDSTCQALTSHQIERFEESVEFFRQRGFKPTHCHLANSAAIYSQPKAFGNMVRPGGALYGLWRDVLPPCESDPQLAPVMSLYSEIIALKWVPAGETVGYACTFEAPRRTLIATLPIGYHDGFIRALSNKGRVMLRSTYAPVVGRISMDLTLLDVTDVNDVEIGDRVTLMGREDSLEITAEQIAQTAGTLSYEVTCGISHRVPRIYR